MLYKTIASPADGKLTEKMSRFLSFAHPVESVDEAKEVIAGYANRYHDARHVCWAYTVGTESPESRSNDDGEPSGTAGRPILGQITSFGLTNVVVVVVRYFGGIKLGTSGLIVAYREAARLALDAAEVVERQEMVELTLRFGYMEMNTVMTIVKRQPQLRVIEQAFDNTCTMRIAVPASETAPFEPYIIEGK